MSRLAAGTGWAMVVLGGFAAIRAPAFMPAPPSAVMPGLGAVSILVLGLCLALLVTAPAARRVRAATLLLAALVLLVSLVSVALTLRPGLGTAFPASIRAGAAAFITPRPLGLAALGVAALGVLALAAAQPGVITSVIGALLATFGFVVLLGLLYGGPLILGSDVQPVSSLGAVAALVFGLGLMLAGGPSAWPNRVFIGNRVGSILLRWFVPLVALSVLLTDLASLRLFENFSHALGSTLNAIVSLIAAVAVISYVGRVLGGRLDRTYRALADSERRFSRVFKSVPATLAISRPADGRLLDVNDEFERVYGYSRDEAIGRTALDLGLWNDAADGQRAVGRVTASPNEVADVELAMRRRDGRELFLRGAMHQIEHQGEQLLITTTIDITDQKRAEMELRRHEEGLEQLVAERTAELHATIRQLRDAEQLRDGLTNMIVHDMRSPLGALIGQLDLLQLTVAGDVAATVDKAARGAKSLNDLANTLLDVSRLEQGQMPVKRAPTDLVKLADDVRASLSALEAGRAIDLVPSPPVMASCDASLIRRVIENLVSNGIKHTPREGRLRIEVSLAGERVRVTVQDEGAGVPAEARTRIFEKFGAAAVRHDRAYHSVGLGLAFCKLAVEAHGGTIGVDDAQPRGSIFHFEVPASGQVRHDTPR